MRDLVDVRAWLAQDFTGTVETAGAPFWRTLVDLRPDVKVVVIRRHPSEVVASLMALSVPFDRMALWKTMAKLDAKLDQIERRVSGVLSVDYDDLSDPETCGSIFTHCLGLPFDAEARTWWSALSPINVQISMPAMVRYAWANRPAIERLASIAKAATLAGFVRRAVQAPDGFVIQQEGFDTFFRDGQDLFRRHCAMVGEGPDEAEGKNWGVMRALAAVGVLQITTARSNGRMFGYLLTVISPSLESTGLTTSINTAFYSEIAGLGLKIQRASLEALRAKGVGEVWWRAGPRGSGPRTGTMYRRLGAVADGEMYRMNLGGTAAMEA